MFEYLIIGGLAFWAIAQLLMIKFWRKRYRLEVSRHARTMQRLANEQDAKEQILQQVADQLAPHGWQISHNDKPIIPRCRHQKSDWPEFLIEEKK